MLISRFNVFKVIKDHVRTFHPGWSEQTNLLEVILYFALPLAPILLLIMINVFQELGEFNGLIEAFSIFTGFLFTFVVLLQQQYQNFQRNSDLERMKLCRETYANAIFCILTSIFTIILLLLNAAFANEVDGSSLWWLSCLLHFLILYFSLLFLITLLMVLKRLYALFDPIHNRGS